MMKDSSPDVETSAEPEQPSTTPSSTGNNKKKWMWVGLAAFAVIAAASITTGVVVSNNNNNKDNNEDESSSDVNGSRGTVPQFAKSKAAIDLLCGEGSTKAECEAECANVPDCCSIGDTSCLVSELEGCVRYAKCQVLAELEEAAPDNLADLCSNADDMTECAAACSAVSCCYSDTEECDSALYFLTCLDYAPCQNLRTAGDGVVVVPTAPPGLDEDCSLDDSGDRDACQATCETASCCWSMDGDAEEPNCLQDNWITCLTYASCGSLVIPEANGVVPVAPEDLYNTTCNLDGIWGADGDRTACEDVCELASCCTADTEEDNCFLEDPIGCLEYVPCVLLPLTGGNIPRAPEDLSETCAWKTIGNATSEKACIDACEPAKCCTDSEDENCFADGNILTCVEYVPCAILIIVGGDSVQGPPDDLQATCSRSGFAEDPQACKTMCEAGAGCCFDMNFAENCVLGNVDKCAAWTTTGCWRNWK